METETADDAVNADDRHTVYAYDATVQTGKTVHEGLDATGNVVATTTLEYNLQGRLSKSTVVAGGDTTVTDYTYNDEGIRVSQSVTENGGATVEHEYLVDANNHTGYAQVLEESINDVLTRAYVLGLDVLSQADTNQQAGDPLHLLYDAHGSTRALIDKVSKVVTGQTFTYDAYGNALGFDPAAALTTLLYSGEQFDAKLAMQYLRARYYDPAVGRFNRLDPFFGSLNDPQSLHKYLYTHGNPINGIDPLGLFNYLDLLGATAIRNYLIPALKSTVSVRGFVSGAANALVGIFVRWALPTESPNLGGFLTDFAVGFAAGAIGVGIEAKFAQLLKILPYPKLVQAVNWLGIPGAQGMAAVFVTYLGKVAQGESFTVEDVALDLFIAIAFAKMLDRILGPAGAHGRNMIDEATPVIKTISEQIDDVNRVLDKKSFLGGVRRGEFERIRDNLYGKLTPAQIHKGVGQFLSVLDDNDMAFIISFVDGVAEFFSAQTIKDIVGL